MPLVVMGAPLGESWAQGEDRRRAIERLDLGLLVDAQDLAIGRVDIEERPTMSRTLSTKSGSGLSLKVLTRWGLSPKARQIRLTALWLMPVALAIDRVEPMGGVERGLFECLDDHRFDVVVRDGAWGARARLVVETVQAIGEEPTTPLAHRVRIEAELLRDLDDMAALGAGKDDPTPQRQRLGALWSTSPTLERLALVVAEHHWFENRPPHRCLQSSLTKGTTRANWTKFPQRD